eukprot:482820-Ditylum_brightwellii.AAC.2
MGDSETATPTIPRREELEEQLQCLSDKIVLLASKHNRMQEQHKPDAEPCTLVDDLVEEEDFLSINYNYRNIMWRIFKDKTRDKEPINPCFSDDPDCNINCFSWSESEHKGNILKEKYEASVEYIKRPMPPRHV